MILKLRYGTNAVKMLEMLRKDEKCYEKQRKDEAVNSTKAEYPVVYTEDYVEHIVWINGTQVRAFRHESKTIWTARRTRYGHVCSPSKR